MSGIEIRRGAQPVVVNRPTYDEAFHVYQELHKRLAGYTTQPVTWTALA